MIINMDNDVKSYALVDFVDKNYELIKKTELIFFIILIVGFICNYLMIPNSSFILVIGAILTAISLFLQAYKMVEFENLESLNILGSLGFINFTYKLYFFALSVSSLSMIGFVHTFIRAIF
jgi:hypothetical protein